MWRLGCHGGRGDRINKKVIMAIYSEIETNWCLAKFSPMFFFFFFFNFPSYGFIDFVSGNNFFQENEDCLVYLSFLRSRDSWIR